MSLFSDTVAPFRGSGPRSTATLVMQSLLKIDDNDVRTTTTLQRVAQKTTDLVFLLYAGHGFQWQDTTGKKRIFFVNVYLGFTVWSFIHNYVRIRQRILNRTSDISNFKEGDEAMLWASDSENHFG